MGQGDGGIQDKEGEECMSDSLGFYNYSLIHFRRGEKGLTKRENQTLATLVRDKFHMTDGFQDKT